MQTLSATKKTKTALLGTALLLISLTACQGAPKFPVKYVFETDTDNGVCGKYEIVDAAALKFKWIEDMPLTSCNGVMGFATEDVSPVMVWVRKMIKRAQEKCSNLFSK